MAKKTTIYLSGPLLQAVGPHNTSVDKAIGPSLSGRLATIAERYIEIIARARPKDLTRAEWCVILDANNGVFEGLGTARLGSMMWANVADSVDEGIGPKWGLTDAQVRDLARRMQALPHTAQVSIVEAVEQFWLRAELETDEALTQAGITPAD